MTTSTTSTSPLRRSPTSHARSPSTALHGARASRSRSSRRLAWSLVLLAVAPVTALAGKKDDAKAHVAKATKAHKAGHFEDARVELEAAYALDPRPDLLYAIGQVYAKLGNCGEAITYYKRFVATQHDPQVAKVVDQAIAACKSPPEPAAEPPPVPDTPPAAPDTPPTAEHTAPRSADQPPPAPAHQPPPASADQPPPAPEDKARLRPAHSQPVTPRRQPFGLTKTAPVAVVAQPRSPWYSDKLGDALVLGGIAATVVGLIEYRSARSDLDAAEDRASTTSLARYHELVDDAHSKRNFSVVLVGAGGALIVSGIVRHVLHRGTTEVRTIGVAPVHGGGVVTYEGRL